MKRLSSLLLSMVLLALVSSVQAATVTPGLYQLLDHPNSGLADGASISYGLRIDALGGSAAERTFSANQDGAYVTLEWDGTNARISGQFSNNATNELWDIEYLFGPTTDAAEGFIVEGAAVGAGALVNSTDNTQVIGLVGASSDIANTIFRALADGHRCSGEPCINGDDTAVARGWLDVFIDYQEYSRDDYTNDFLVQLTPVPVPAALPLLISGILGFSVFSRKKKLS